jgi:hypothetical protein
LLLGKDGLLLLEVLLLGEKLLLSKLGGILHLLPAARRIGGEGERRRRNEVRLRGGG